MSKTGSDMGLERIDGQNVTADVLLNALTAVPFLATSRLVIIEDLGSNKGLASKIDELIRDVPETTVALFYETEVDQRTAYYKTMISKAKPVKFESLTSSGLSRWVRLEVERLKGQIDTAAIAKLIDIVGDDQWRLEQEIMKLVNYRARVSVESVDAMVIQTPQQTIFDLVEAMSGKRVKTAVSIFRDLIAQRTNEVYILSMIIWQLRNLLLAKTAGAITQVELAKRAGMSPYVAGKALVRQRDFSEEDLQQAFLAAIRTDYELKSGQGEPEELVERLIYRVSTGTVRVRV